MAKEEIKEYNANYYIQHKKEAKEYGKEYYKIHKEKLKEYWSLHRSTHKKQAKEYAAKYYILHKEKLKKHTAQYRKTHSNNQKEYLSKYRKIHKEESKEYHSLYFKQRRLSDSLFRLRLNLGNRTSRVFKRLGFDKKVNTKGLLGADYKTVMQYIDFKFTFGMSWDKVGKEIHIDHIIPLSSAKTKKQLIRLCHYTNLQPLWAKDNLRKGNKSNYTINIL